MIHNFKYSVFLKTTRISFCIVLLGLFGAIMGSNLNIQAQKSTSKTASSVSKSTAVQQPPYSEYKGVRIGMTTDEVRGKLGQPTQVVEDLDFYVITEAESVQVFYDTAHKVTAISIDHVGTQGALDPKGIVGADIEVRPDGSMYKLVRYDHLGFWVSFNRTSGAVPTTSVTIQKIL